MVTTLELPSASDHSKAKTSPSPSPKPNSNAFSALRLPRFNLWKAFLSKRKGKQASASASSLTEVVEEKPISSPMEKTVAKEEEEKPTNKSSSTPSCLPLRKLFVLNRNQTPSKEEEEEEAASSSSSKLAPTVNDLEEKYNLIRSIGEECTTEAELHGLLANKSEPICYDGFEPSDKCT